MAKRDDVFPSKYLRAADLNGNPVTVTIVSAPLETLKNPEGKEQTKTVLYFRGTKKLLPLNVTNWDAVADICGDDSDDWAGKAIELYPAKTQMGGKIVDCIRVRASGQLELPTQEEKPAAKAKVKAKVKVQPAHDDMDDSIPF
jgi:hypothetical protein